MLLLPPSNREGVMNFGLQDSGIYRFLHWETNKHLKHVNKKHHDTHLKKTKLLFFILREKSCYALDL